MHAIHLSPHTREVVKSAAERTTLGFVALGGVALALLSLAVISWVLWANNI